MNHYTRCRVLENERADYCRRPTPTIPSIRTEIPPKSTLGSPKRPGFSAYFGVCPPSPEEVYSEQFFAQLIVSQGTCADRKRSARRSANPGRWPWFGAATAVILPVDGRSASRGAAFVSHGNQGKGRRPGMAQIEVKVKLDLPPGVELLGYERCGEPER